ncbi:alpha/beta hydrolase [Flectobacillus longus]|uniref:alpha/beta hydrolase n=1 Tax=Flectobacillus longus TaxID=2984207 RepID=UPI0024B7E683|nr:alpha/beta hydrolase [Flectobacillus longus]MDI9879173.1 alpha/beta hydrolase [Flectobacillus longus]
MKNRKIYLLSGLGVDGRVFDNIDLNEYQPQLIEWIPLLNHEDISEYAQRLSTLIEPKSVLIGLSFGGMVAIEIAKYISVCKIILVSSASNFRQIPWLFRLWDWSKFIKVLPKRLILKANPVTFWLFGITRRHEKILLTQILADTDYNFLFWAVRQIIQWKNTEVNSKVIHLHGTKDRLLQQPLKISPAEKYWIKDGGHFMIITHSDEIEGIIRKELKQ